MNAARSRSRKRVVRAALFSLAAAVAVAGAAAAAVTGISDPTRQQLIAERSAEVMPFDLAATTHHFEPVLDGGLQTVVADDPADRQQIELIQQHLRNEAAAFRRGEFSDPAQIHGEDMPGLATLEANAHLLDIAFQARVDGAELRYTSGDPVVIDALHDWFAAQTADHQGHAG